MTVTCGHAPHVEIGRLCLTSRFKYWTHIVDSITYIHLRFTGFKMWAYLLPLLVPLVAEAAVDSDLVTNLPGLPSAVSFRHYSGYLEASDKHLLHYWFIESAGNPAKDPVVLWMNGGPGCSSMDGLLSEHGPFIANDDGKTLHLNPHSWNKVANMLYLEAPIGVGYSYSTDDIYIMNDDKTAADNHRALQYFFKMYPEFAGNDFFITGESYGGIYVPTLSVLAAKDSTMNFKGMAVGNGMSDYRLNSNSLMFFGYYHGLWSEQLWEQLTTYCCTDAVPDKDTCNFYNSTDVDCQNAVQVASGIIYGLNVYNLYDECYTSGSMRNRSSLNHPLFTIFRRNRHVQAQFQRLLKEPKAKVTTTPPCINADGMIAYMNQPDVRTALHIKSELPRWDICSDRLRYNTTYENMKQQYIDILSSGKHRIMVYNGDVDMACNFLMDEWFVDSLKQKPVTPYKPWHFTATDGTQQVAGFSKQFKNLCFVTVKGAGHMVPQNKPIPSLEMLTNFVTGQPFQ